MMRPLCTYSGTVWKNIGGLRSSKVCCETEWGCRRKSIRLHKKRHNCLRNSLWALRFRDVKAMHLWQVFTLETSKTSWKLNFLKNVFMSASSRLPLELQHLADGDPAHLRVQQAALIGSDIVACVCVLCPCGCETGSDSFCLFERKTESHHRSTPSAWVSFKICADMTAG